MADPIKPPLPSKADKIQGLVKAALGAAPGGPIFMWLVDSIWKPALEQRLEDWMSLISNDLNALNKRDEELFDNQRFINILTHATRLAVQNHSHEKLSALRNAVRNSAEEPPYDESVQTLFMNYIDRLSEWHLTLFLFFCDPKWLESLESFGHGQTATREIVLRKFPTLQGKEPFVNLIIKDLHDLGLIDVRWHDTNIHAMNRGASLPELTTLGKDFHHFIRP